ncbi:FAD-dependent monooxygenase [Marinobacterium aestuariivivens]|uniref:FAD-dependent monooxygenase n=1 Tax=Marinobacterium aestuariivivens TaxID=1698799 RepID=A0ABW2A085_9GAMM
MPALGYVVENHWLGQVLLERLQQPDAARIDYLCPAEVAEIRPGSERMAVTLSRDGRVSHIGADLVVMADGGRSELRERLGIGYHYQTYDQHALIANVSPDRPHRGIAWERFTDQGPMALLPLGDQQGRHRCGLVWTVPDEAIDALMTVDDARFLQQLQQRFGYRAGRFVGVGERHAYPLKLVLAEEQVRPGLVVLGNAAHALHPIAGQGYNLALRGLVALADHLIEARRRTRPLGDLGVLQAYHDWMRRDQQRTIGFSDRTMKLFPVPIRCRRWGVIWGFSCWISAPRPKPSLPAAPWGSTVLRRSCVQDRPETSNARKECRSGRFRCRHRWRRPGRHHSRRNLECRSLMPTW